MSQGRKPKPTHLKLLQGNPGKRAIGTAEPEPEAILMDAPDWLDTIAQEEWARMMPELHRWRLFTAMDVAALAAYCANFSRWRQAEAKLAQLNKGQDLPFIVKSPKGYPIQSPYLAISNRAQELMRVYLALFGMSPSDRVRLQGVTQGELFDAFDSFVKQA